MTDNMAEILDQWLSSRMERVHTCLPGYIEDYEASKRKASVKPAITQRNQYLDEIAIPVISDVPVIFPGSSEFQMHFPLKQGDGCLILFSESGIGNFLNSEGESSSDSPARFQLSDAICIPGLFSFKSAPELVSGSDNPFFAYSGNTLEFQPSKVVINGNLEVLQ